MRNRPFRRDDDGSVTFWSITFTVIFLLIGGLAIDYGNGVRARAHLQATADAAALAAVLDLPDTTAAAATAAAYVETNSPTSRFGNVLVSSDVEFGQWVASTRTFSAGLQPYTAVRVSVERSKAHGNPLGTFLLKLAGVWSVDVRAEAVARSSSRCSAGGFFSGNRVLSGSLNEYVDGFCIHGENYVKIESLNSFADGVTVSMPDLTQFQQGSSNTGIANALRQASQSLTLPAQVPGVIASMQSGSLAGLPGYITNGPVYVGKIDPSTTLQPNTLYVASDEVQLGSNRTISKVAIVSAKKIATGSQVVMDDVVLATPSVMEFGSYNEFGNPNFCNDGTYGVYAFSGKNMQFGSYSLFQGMQLASQQMAIFHSILQGVKGLYAEAADDIQYESSDVYGGCPDGLMSELDIDLPIVTALVN